MIKHMGPNVRFDSVLRWWRFLTPDEEKLRDKYRRRYERRNQQGQRR